MRDHVRKLRAVAVPLIWWTCACARPASAQTALAGTLVDASTGGGLEGAMVVLLSGDTPVSRVLSAGDGSFVLRLTRGGRYELRIDRIGFASVRAGPYEVAEGASRFVRIEVGVEPIRLVGLDVTGAERCEPDPRGGTTARVWEEARKALEAATWTRDRGMYRFAWIKYVRELGAKGEMVLTEERDRRAHFLAQPFRTIHPDTLHAEGFVLDRPGETVYAAPDAAVLLSDRFLETHCFRVDERVTEGRRLLGLRFEPISSRRLPDVEGVLWLEARTGLLETLEYRYVNLGRRAVVTGDEASGRIAFRALPNGTWVVDDWSIRMPRLVEMRDEVGTVRFYDVRGYVEEGGTVTRIVAADGDVVAESEAEIRGTVRDSVGAPMVGASVWLQGTDVEAETDRNGRFRLRGLTAGVWTVRANHSRLASFGHLGTAAEVTVNRGLARDVTLGLPSVAVATAGRCAERGAADAATLLVGRVVDTSGAPLAGTPVRVTWVARRTTTRRTFEGLRLETDSVGSFAGCSIPADADLVVVADGGEGVEGSVTAQAGPPGSVTSADVTMGERVRSSIRRPREWRVSEAPAAPWLDSIGFRYREGEALLHLTQAQIVRIHADSLTRVLEAAPRIEVFRQASGRTSVRLHPTEEWARGTGGCEPDFHLNGSLVRQRIDRNWEAQVVRLVPPRGLTAIEIFEGARSPVGDRAGCGAVLLWSKDLRHRDDPPFEGFVRGRVSGLDADAGTPTLTLEPGAIPVEVDPTGHFGPLPVPPARYLLRARIEGLGTWEMDLDVRAESVVEVELDAGGRRPPS